MVSVAPAFSHPEYNFVGRYCVLPNAKPGAELRMHYLDEGPRDAPVVLMVHGNPSWSFYFRQVVHTLRGEFRCIVPDHIGMGLSSCPTDAEYRYTLASRIADLGSLMRSLALPTSQPIHLLVHDWGGAIGLGWALKNGENRARIASLSLFNTAAFLNPRGRRIPKELWLTRTQLGEHLVLKHNAFARGAIRFGITRKKLRNDLRDAYLAPYSDERRLATLRFVQDIPLSEKDEAFAPLAETEVALRAWAKENPAVFIGWGMRDFVFTAPFLRTWDEIFPSAERHVLADAGHYVLEDAWGDLQAPLLAFLRRAAAAKRAHKPSTAAVQA